MTRDEVFDCERGAYRMGRRVLHDHHPYSALSVTDILVKSSNIGMAKIGERLTNRELYAATVTFGFGRRTWYGIARRTCRTRPAIFQLGPVFDRFDTHGTGIGGHAVTTHCGPCCLSQRRQASESTIGHGRDGSI